jgi:Tol biopolymer transport system component
MSSRTLASLAAAFVLATAAGPASADTSPFNPFYVPAAETAGSWTACGRPYSCWGATGARPMVAVGQTTSPDRAWVAFAADRGGDFELYRVRPDGWGLSRITDHPAGDFSPVFSPDGTRIAFVSGRDGGPALYIVAADRSGQPVRLSAPGDPETQVFDPVFSPDGRAIAYVTARAGATEVHAVGTDGSGRPRVVNRPIPDAFGPAFSADGRLITFKSVAGERELMYAAAADGSDEPTLLGAPVASAAPAAAR